MRQILVALTLVGLAVPAAAAEPPLQQQRAKRSLEAAARCQKYQPQPTAEARRFNGPMKLTQAPPARMERAVNRRFNGCVVPVIVRHDVEKTERWRRETRTLVLLFDGRDESDAGGTPP